MKKDLLIARLADQAQTSKSSAERIIDALVNLVHEFASTGEPLRIPHLGTFETRTRAAKQGRNPATGAAMHIPERTAIVFKPAGALKAAANSTDTPH